MNNKMAEIICKYDDEIERLTSSLRNMKNQGDSPDNIYRMSKLLELLKDEKIRCGLSPALSRGALNGQR